MWCSILYLVMFYDILSDVHLLVTTHMLLCDVFYWGSHNIYVMFYNALNGVL